MQKLLQEDAKPGIAAAEGLHLRKRQLEELPM